MQITETKHLLIREYTSLDRKKAFEILMHQETMSFWPEPFTEKKVEAWLARGVDAYRGRGMGRFAVVLRATNEVIGDAGIVQTEVNGQKEWDLGYIIHADHWGHGFGVEVAGALLDYVFRYTDLERVIAHFAQEHVYSKAVAERIGMAYEQSFVNEKNLGKTHDLFVMDRKSYIVMRRERLIDRIGGSDEKRNWLGLATSFTMNDRLLALETAEAIKDEIQVELLYWFCNALQFPVKMRLFNLLDEEHQQLATKAFGDAYISPLDGDESFRYFISSKDEGSLQAQVIMEANRVVPKEKRGMYPLPEGKMQFLKLYSQVNGTSMGEAKKALLEVFGGAREY